jgi:type I restriction enzyme R subunit
MTNFDYLEEYPEFHTFASVAQSAEKIAKIDPGACIINCRRSMEMAVKWMYSVDSELKMPYRDNLVTLIHTDEFEDIVDPDIRRRIEFIRRLGNQAAHSNARMSLDQAKLCLCDLFYILDFVAYCYAPTYTEHKYDASLIDTHSVDVPAEKKEAAVPEVDLEALIAENKALKEELTKRREQQSTSYVSKPVDLSEYKTRKIYIDSMLVDSGWVEGRNWANEVEVDGMPNDSGKGYADYVLYDDAMRPLAVIEAKKTCVDVAKGREQARLYADSLERKYHRRPVIFLTNGFDTRIIDGQYPERACAAIWSKRDLEKWFNLLAMRTSLKHIVVDSKIAGRYYQEAAIKAVCESFDEKNRRKALLVMATGSGKTRTVIALCKVLMDAGWIKNVLFLADRTALVTQAKRSFVNLLPDLSVSNITEEKDNYNAHCIFSTYQTMINLIDTAKDEEGKIFSSGHFDLVICDEAHRSIYNKYRDIFNYFDALLVGLTATPKDEIDRNTYQVFDLENGVPTYGYDLEQAVKDGYLVNYQSIETKMKFLQIGIHYDDLTEEEKEEYEDCFTDENGKVPEFIESSALNSWVFNEDTIRKVLQTLMDKGLKIDYGEKIGKTIIFAKNHEHAEKILQVFHKYYSWLPDDFAKVIDNQIKFSQHSIDEFSDPAKMPQIAISVDMLDTGIDVPEVLNLVFFKKVLSKAKFWQMIGRGTRLCPGLIDGNDKDKFYIFDFCGNFEFFRMGKPEKPSVQIPLQSAIFNLQFEIAYKLQTLETQTEELKKFREDLVDTMCAKVSKLDKDNFAVRQHLRYVEKYAKKEGYQGITYPDILIVKEEVAPLILPDIGDISAVRFDALVYGIELAILMNKKYTASRRDLVRHVRAVADIANVPEIQAKSEFINQILHTSYLDHAGIFEFEKIRTELRDLMKYIQGHNKHYDTNFSDDILDISIHTPDAVYRPLENYKKKAEYYVRTHQDMATIAKLKSNQPLTKHDLEILEEVLWSEVGTKEQYEKEYGNQPLGEFVRSIVGLDMNAAKQAFAAYLNNTDLDSRQIYFVNQIVEYIVHNGMMKDLSVLQEAPFTDHGSIVDIFPDLNVWMGIRKVIDQINANAD